MIFVLIYNKPFLTKVISYLDNTDLKYTTNPKLEFDYILVAEMNKKVETFLSEHESKKVIFFTHLEESKIYYHFQANNKRSRMYKNRYYNFLNRCYKVIVSLPYFQKMFEKKQLQIKVIPLEIPIINISKNTKDIYDKYNIPKRKKKILVVDSNYHYLKQMDMLVHKYPKQQFLYLGYEPGYLLKEKQQKILYHLPDNVTYIKHLDFNIFSDLCKISDMVIYLDYSLPIDYLYVSLLFKCQLLVEEIPFYEDFLVNSKNCYMFRDDSELILKVGKILDNRVGNLTDKAYELVYRNSLTEIVKKYNDYLR